MLDKRNQVVYSANAMNNGYLTLEQAADYLGVSEDTVRRYADRGDVPAYKLDRALRFRFDDLDALLSRLFEVLLTPGLRAAVKHSTQTQEGVGAWRVIVSFYNTKGDKRLVVPFSSKGEHTEYYVWVTEEYLDDHARLPASVIGAEKFALKYIKQRFEETKDKGGDRDITRIVEDSVVCAMGKCTRGNSLTLHYGPRDTNTLEKRVKALEETMNDVPDNDPKGKDKLLDEAIALAKPLNAISASYLQRKLSIGYARAARLLDQLEKMGMIRSGEGLEPRKVIK